MSEESDRGEGVFMDMGEGDNRQVISLLNYHLIKLSTKGHHILNCFVLLRYFIGLAHKQNLKYS